MQIITFLVAGLINGLIGVFYFRKFIFRTIKEFTRIKINKKINIFITTFLTIVAFSTTNLFSLVTNIYIHILVITLLYEGLNHFLKKHQVYRFLFYSGTLTILTVGLIFAYGYYNMNNVVLTEYILESEKIDNLKILQITDLHINNSVTSNELKGYVSKMNALNADIVALTGDIFDHHSSLEDVREVCQILGHINNNKGIYYIYGNHERTRSNGILTEEYIKAEFEKNGIIVLKDEIYTIDNISIVGRMDAGWSRSGIERKKASELLNEVDKNNYILVLDHQPKDIEENASLGADLQLSGHTHGGQYFPSGPIEELFSGTLIYGPKEIDNFTAITSSGISGWGAPFKTGSPSEYVLITVK